MNKLSGFPIYGMANFYGERMLPVGVEYKNRISLFIEFSEDNAEETSKNLAAILKQISPDVYHQVEIKKLFNIADVEFFRNSFDWCSKRVSDGFFSQLKFTETDGNILLTERKFTSWEN